MPNNSTAPLTFYPAYCFALSPTYSTWARLTATDVYALSERSGFGGQNLYFHLNHPIKWIRLVGFIVTFDIHPTRFIMVLDDGSGSTIEVTCARKAAPPPIPNLTGRPALGDHMNGLTNVPLTESEPHTKGLTATGRDIDLQGVDIGSVVKIKGGIGDFRGQRQVLLERISIVRTTTEEAAAWDENTAFRLDVLDHPWVVGEEEWENARRKAEGLDRERELRKRKKRRKIIEKGGKRSGRAATRKGPESERDQRRKEDDKWRRREGREGESNEELERRRREEEVMRKIEEEDAERKWREEVAREMSKEQDRKWKEEERKRKEKEETRRKDEEERERMAEERRRRNEARERALREMGAGR